MTTSLAAAAFPAFPAAALLAANSIFSQGQCLNKCVNNFTRLILLYY